MHKYPTSPGGATARPADMGTTYTSLTYHVVFSTKYRRNTITPDIKDRLYEYIGGIIRAEKGVLLEIGGIEDHVHLLAGFPQPITGRRRTKLHPTARGAPSAHIVS